MLAGDVAVGLGQVGSVDAALAMQGLPLQLRLDERLVSAGRNRNFSPASVQMESALRVVCVSGALPWTVVIATRSRCFAA